MSVTAIFTGIVAIAQAVPKVAAIIDKFYDLYIDAQVKKINNSKIEKRDKRKALMKAITKAGTDAERKALSIVLNDVDNM